MMFLKYRWKEHSEMSIAYLLLLLVIQSFCAVDKLCPNACKCDTSTKKMKCSENNWTENELKNKSLFYTPEYLQNLDLSKNRISKLEKEFLNVPGLRKLILSENRIRFIDAAAFRYLSGLKTLDLSANYIEFLPKGVFNSVKSLEKLKLRKNQLMSLDSFVLVELTSLKVLDMSENRWHCDCNILMIKDWASNNSVNLQPLPKCLTPELFYGVTLKRLDLVCPGPWGLELSPSNNQVVFAGDSLALRCRSVGDAERVAWVRDDVDVTQYSEIDVSERTLHEHGLVESWLRIDHLQPQHSGNWICREVAGKNHSATVSVLVLSATTKYCPDIMTRNNKGAYFWPRTVVGHAVELPCIGDQTGASHGFASYSCSEEGEWELLNTSACPFVSEITRILEQFSRDSLAKDRETILERAKKLHNLTSATDTLRDPIDAVFVSHTLETYAPLVDDQAIDLGLALVDIVAAMSKMTREMLLKAQLRGHACTRILKALENVAGEIPAFQAHGTSLAIEEFEVAPDRFIGMACIWRSMPSSSTRLFKCVNNGLAVLEVNGREVEAAIELPASLFSGLSLEVHQLVVTMFANGHLFPDVRNDSDVETSSSVVGANIVGVGSVHLNESVSVMAKVRAGVAATPAWWDNSLLGGNGGWNTEGCHASHFNRDLLVFHCDRLGYYALLQDRDSPYLGIQSKWGYTALYSGCCVLLVCLSAAIVTYVLCHGAVQMSRRAKHAVVNTWASICLLCFLYSFGVFATENVRVCECIGLALHYFSLCTLLWMAVVGNHMYKRLSRGATDRTPDELPPGVPLHKPILGLYLVGWGIGLIVCGISGAVHLRDYAQPAFCFLGAGPALSAVLVPTAILVTLLCVFYFLSLCAIRNNDVNGQLSEGTQGTEHVDLELLEDGAGCAERRSARSVLTDSEDIEDTEHSPVIQLKAHVIVLILFLILWASAALATTASVYPVIPWQESIASGIFCLSAFCLGAFILYFYCVARSDVRARWGAWRRMMGKQRRCCRSRSVSDTHATLPLQAAAPTVFSNGPSSVISGVTGHSSSSHRTKAVTELNNCERVDSATLQSKPSNSVNLVAMHRQIYRSNNSMPTYHEISGHESVDVFYNPRQSIVAKKFFKKQRRNKRNELGLRRRGDGGGTSEGESVQPCRTWRPSAESAVFLSSDMENNSEKLSSNMFGYGSKINNTNIHVGASSHRKECTSPKDPNLLSENDDDKGSGKMLLARLVIGAEEDVAGPSIGLGRVEEEEPGPAADCRSVELQCSLGDSSDVPDCDDSFSQKIDNLRLPSDLSCTESLSSPPQYVTVLDPKYGVVKVTVSDYQRQSDTLSLAYPSEPRGSLPSTPEELDDPSVLDTAEGQIEEESRSPVVDCRSVELQCCLGDASDISNCDDSFGTRIDNLQLHSDHSCAESLSSPPQYVTVLDPKYGVVKVTMSDYQRQSDTLSLAYPSEPRGSLPSTPEELDDPRDLYPDEADERQPLTAGISRSPPDQSQVASGSALSESQERLMERRSNSQSPASTPRISSRHSSGERQHSRSLPFGPFPRNYVFRKRHHQRRSLPSSPESRTPVSGSLQRLSLPSSPEARIANDLSSPPSSRPFEYRRQSPRLTLPPPPDLPVPDNEYAPGDIEGGGEEQWQRPSPPTSPQDCSPSRRRSQRPRPMSDNFADRQDSPAHRTFSLTRSHDPPPDSAETKKETSV